MYCARTEVRVASISMYHHLTAARPSARRGHRLGRPKVEEGPDAGCIVSMPACRKTSGTKKIIVRPSIAAVTLDDGGQAATARNGARLGVFALRWGMNRVEAEQVQSRTGPDHEPRRRLDIAAHSKPSGFRRRRRPAARYLRWHALFFFSRRLIHAGCSARKYGAVGCVLPYGVIARRVLRTRCAPI